MAGQKQPSSSGRKKRLGRGLGSLISNPVAIEQPSDETSAEANHVDSTTQEQLGGQSSQAAGDLASGEQAAARDGQATSSDTIAMIPVHQIVPNRRQPRQEFDPQSLAELADSIRQAGLMQPILVRRIESSDDGSQYEVIAGERRLRAARLVPLEAIPAIVRSLDDQAAAEWALIENLQREDLNPMERAEAFRSLAEDFGLTHQQIAESVGLTRSTVSNTLRLNDLYEPLKLAVRIGTLSSGHAKALLSLSSFDDQERVASLIIEESWSVRQTEDVVTAVAAGTYDFNQPQVQSSGSRALQARSEGQVSPHLASLQERLGRHLGTRVLVKPGRKAGTGKLVIEFYDHDQFDGLLSRIGFDSDAEG